MRAFTLLIGTALLVTTTCACAQPSSAPATAPVGKFPHVQVDVKARQVRVACQALRVEAPLEFFCCVTGTSEHEAVLRSPAKPSHVHAALLMVGLEPGEPVRYSEAAKKWLPPHGPPLRISVEFEENGKRVSVPAYKLMRSVKTKEPMPALTWIFAGSRVMEDGNYAADVTGYLVSIVNFDLTVIDVPALASNANEALEWETNLDKMPEAGAPVTMVIEPAGKEVEPSRLGAPGPIDVPLIKLGRGELSLDDRPMSVAELDAALALMRDDGRTKVRLAAADDAPPLLLDTARRLASKHGVTIVDAQSQQQQQQQSGTGAGAGATPGALRIDQQKLDDLRRRWDAAVKPHAGALREAAQTQYDVLAELRREQQRLIDEADRIQRVIDELEREYQDMTTPRPAHERANQP